ncbi:MAG: hypothetical protein Q9190_006066 [Brigantiaea leucoxantha]
MSRLSSPARSETKSSLSAPESSQDARSHQELTPRSKIRAMLAAVDDDSDLSQTEQRSRKEWNESSVGPILGKEIKPGAHQEAEGGSSGESSGREEPVAPRGRIAARLQGQQKRSYSSISTSNDENSNKHGAVKRKMLPTKERKSTNKGVHGENIAIVTSERQSQRKGPISDDPASVSPSLVNQLSSPGLFLSPKSPEAGDSFSRTQAYDSDSDMPLDPKANNRLLALVARKRREREEKAAAEEQRKQERHQQEAKPMKQSGPSVEALGSSENESGTEGAQRLTQQARPTRKASKKALEEMNRETQRMSRNMQLAHQAKTRKKITKESLFARFNFRTNTPMSAAPIHANSSSAATSSNPASDAEAKNAHNSPPTSPLSPDHDAPKKMQRSPTRAGDQQSVYEGQTGTVEKELPDTVELMSELPSKQGKGKGKGSSNESQPQPINTHVGSPRSRREAVAQQRMKVYLPKTTNIARTTEDSDSDLEIVSAANTKASKLDVFDRLPGKKISDGRTLQTLRALAHLTSPSKNDLKSNSSITLSDMHMLLQKRARQQAAQERAEKVQELRRKGAIIQTSEEREKDQIAVEDLLEKARREAAEVMQKEKAAARKHAKANGETVREDNSSEEDEDYEVNDADESDVELSGSDEEEVQECAGESNDEDEDEDEEEGGIQLDTHSEHLIDDEASDTLGDKESEDDQINNVSRKRRKIHVIDDEDDDEDQKINAKNEQPQIPSETQASTLPPVDPGLPIAVGAPLGLTQAFAATMAESQSEEQEQDSLAFLGPPPEPEFPIFNMQDSLEAEDSQPMVLNSQNATDVCSQGDIQFDLSQLQSLNREASKDAYLQSATQLSEMPDPTQDAGFTKSSPIVDRFLSPSHTTQDTIMVPRSVEPESPILKKKGRLQRGKPITAIDDSDLDSGEQAHAQAKSANAFDVLKTAVQTSTHRNGVFDKKRSEAHEMVEEQAQESEDEYAGLGGASDEESGHEEGDEEMKKMIEDGEVDVDERELAAFYADKERASDSAAVSKLFKDLSSGNLRRKRGAGDFDLSDSEEDDETRIRSDA